MRVTDGVVLRKRYTLSVRFVREIRLVGQNERQRTASLSGEVKDYDEGTWRRVECTLTLRAHGLDCRKSATDFFEAFCKIRTELEKEGVFPLCYGASWNVYPSAMGRDMALGLKAYRIRKGHVAMLEDLVEIFDSGADVQVATVEEQRRYWREWMGGAD